MAIRNNAIYSPDYNKAFYLAIDRSGKSIRGILF